MQITPIHCAAINPNTKYLDKLFTVLPNLNITDADNWKPIHYASVCEGDGPLKYIVDKYEVN